MKTRTSKQILQRRIIAGALAVIGAILIFSFSHIPGKSLPSGIGLFTIVAHFSEYLLFASVLVIALTGGRLKAWQVVALAIVLASAYGATDEFHQSFIPGRTPDPLDWLTDALGASVGAALTALALRRLDRKS